MKRTANPAQRAASVSNIRAVHADRARLRAEGMAAAVAWRESRRCPECQALAWQPCLHRPIGFGSVATELPIEWPLRSTAR